MTCRNCGREINDGSVFCPHCGTTQALSPESPWNAASGGSAPAWEGPEGGGKKKRTGLFIGIGVAVAAVIALVAVFAGGLFSNPKKQVEAAFVKSAAAYAQAYKKLDLPDTAQWQKDKNIAQRLKLELKSVNSDLVGYDLSALSGLALGFRTDFLGADRLMSCELAAGWGEEELIDLWIKAEDDELYFNSPQLTGNTHYGVNTETLGADLTAMTGDNSMEDLSFNLFDLVDLALEKLDQRTLEQDITAASKSLWEQAEVKKTGSKGVNLSGVDTKTTAYQVTISQEALEQFADDLESALSALNYSEFYEEMFQAMGMPQEEIQDFLDDLESVDVYGELADGLREAVDEIGDLTLDVCLSNGYVSAVKYENYLFNNNTFVNISLFLGGGEEYVDDLRLELKVDDQFITVDSSGDHGLKHDIFTDETVIKGPFPTVTSEMSLDPTQEMDNFHWRLTADNSGLLFALNMAGNMDWSRDDYLSLDLGEISLQAMGAEVCSLSCEYYVDCRPSTAIVEDPKLITRMDQMELMMAALEVQSKAEAWAGEMEELFVSRLPAELLYGMLY